MSNEQIYGGPLRATVTKSPNVQEVSVSGDGVSATAASNNLVKSISMALNEVYRPEVTLEERYESVDRDLYGRYSDIVDKEYELEKIIESYEEHTWLPDNCADPYRDVLEVVRNYREEMEVAMDVLAKEYEHAFGNEQNSA